ncbi:hypothetical protein TUM20984_10550 [Mycobacterium antarcticum]|nr:hypothetical protein TUM20984_10550 [Mycolicibacterium sp. TUM20984]
MTGRALARLLKAERRLTRRGSFAEYALGVYRTGCDDRAGQNRIDRMDPVPPRRSGLEKWLAVLQSGVVDQEPRRTDIRHDVGARINDRLLVSKIYDDFNRVEPQRSQGRSLAPSALTVPVGEHDGRSRFRQHGCDTQADSVGATGHHCDLAGEPEQVTEVVGHRRRSLPCAPRRRC